MKSHITMLEIVRRKAENMGIRSYLGWVGVLITEKEIRKIYAENAFNVAVGRKVHKRHIQNWEMLGEAFGLGMSLDDDKPFAVFFDIPDLMRPSVRPFLESNLMTEDKVLWVVQWPALVEKGLLTVMDEMEEES